MAHFPVPITRQVRVETDYGVVVPAQPSRVLIAWPYEPLLSFGAVCVLIGLPSLLLLDLSTRTALLTAALSVLGIMYLALGISIALARRRWERIAYRRASAAVLATRTVSPFASTLRWAVLPQIGVPPARPIPAETGKTTTKA